MRLKTSQSFEEKFPIPTMTFTLTYISIFPELFTDFLRTSLIGKAHDRGYLESSTIDVREFSSPPHYKVDDTPYGGGAGMLMLAEPLAQALEKARIKSPKARIVVMSASGKLFDQQTAADLAKSQGIIFVCGRYEGIDQRVIDLFHAEEICVGSFVTFGGEIPAMLITEAVTRLIPEVIGNGASLHQESFSGEEAHLVEAPQYTKPREFRGMMVPEPLVSGDPKKIKKWQVEHSEIKTVKNRPDLIRRVSQSS